MKDGRTHEGGMLRRVAGPEREEGTEGRRKMNELHNAYLSPVTRAVK
jgi:hypothetical protein